MCKYNKEEKKCGVYFEEGENYNINRDARVKAIRYRNSNVIEIKYTKYVNKYLKRFKRINKNEYVNTETGEIKKYKHTGKRDINNLKRAMNKLKQLLKNNFIGGMNELFITLTTREVETSFDNIIKNYKKFWKKLKRKYKDLEYVFVVELQKERKSWHIHTLIKDMKNKYLYIDNEEIQEMWEQGNTKTKRITKQNNIEVTKNGIITLEEKTNIEGLIDYLAKTRTKEDIPLGKKTYYKSRGIKEADIEEATYKKVYDEIRDKYNLEKERTLLARSKKTDYIMNVTKTETWKQSNIK